MPPDPPRLKTPDRDPGIFRRVNGTAALQNLEDGSMWERDHAEHGGPQWKRWPSRHAWERGRPIQSVWPEGRVRK